MKRAPLAVSFILFIALCVSATYWAMQWIKPAARPVAAVVAAKAEREVKVDAASQLFGGRKARVAGGENYGLKGVMVSANPGQSVAILAVEGRPTQVVVVGDEVARGVRVKEVHPGYILLSEGSSERRIALPEKQSPRDRTGK